MRDYPAYHGVVLGLLTDTGFTPEHAFDLGKQYNQLIAHHNKINTPVDTCARQIVITLWKTNNKLKVITRDDE